MVREMEDFDDKYLDWLKELPKVLVNPNAKWSKEPNSKFQKIYTAKAEGETGKNELEFQIYMRYNIKNPDSYSCGISIYKVSLARYNGSAHSHWNTRRGEYHEFPKINSGTCHIHQASQTAIMEGKRVDHYATLTDKYNNLDDALVCLLNDYNVTGCKGVNQRRLL